ncbi:MAG TPA: hypothetical protein VMP01_11230 [Pirellulaceae bacterium]|nr:hypothetical protein [Pirellulaceae bacterium]
MADKINEQVAHCQQIIQNSEECAAEINLLLGALARHPDWSEHEVLELHRQLVLDFADQLCERR